MQVIPAVAIVVLAAARVPSPAVEAKPTRCEMTAAVDGSEIVARCGERELFRTTYVMPALVPKKDRLEPSSESESIGDYFEVAGDLVIVQRGVHVLGEFCHTPSVERVEVFTRDGRFHTYTKDDASLFSGRTVASPDRAWTVLLETAEGTIYGYGVLDENGVIIDGERLDAAIEDEGGTFEGDTFVVEGRSSGKKRARLVISRDGQYRIE